jgi:tetratricopeptide (TPR) repeat protein
MLPATLNLGRLLNTRGENAEAEAVLRAGLEHHADEGELHYSLGLLLAEMGRGEESAAALEAATKRLPDRSRVRYNYGLALQRLGRREEAAKQFEVGRRRDPSNPDFVYALAILHAQNEDWDAALGAAEALVELMPGAPGPTAMLDDLRRRAGR